MTRWHLVLWSTRSRNPEVPLLRIQKVFFWVHWEKRIVNKQPFFWRSGDDNLEFFFSGLISFLQPVPQVLESCAPSLDPAIRNTSNSPVEPLIFSAVFNPQWGIDQVPHSGSNHGLVPEKMEIPTESDQWHIYCQLGDYMLPTTF